MERSDDQGRIYGWSGFVDWLGVPPVVVSASAPSAATRYERKTAPRFTIRSRTSGSSCLASVILTMPSSRRRAVRTGPSLLKLTGSAGSAPPVGRGSCDHRNCYCCRFAFERLNLANCTVPALGGSPPGPRRDRRGAGRDRGSPSSASSRSAGSCSSGRRGESAMPPPERLPWLMRSAVLFLAVACAVLGLVPGPAIRRLARARPGLRNPDITAGLHLPGTGSLPTFGIAIALVGLTGSFFFLRGGRRATPAPSWACGRTSAGSSAGRARDCQAPEARARAAAPSRARPASR